MATIADRTRDAAAAIDRLSAISLLGGALVAFYLAPVATLAVAVAPADLLSSLATPTVRSAAATSLATASASTLLATVCGVPLGYWLARTPSRLSAVAFGIVLIPLVLPPTVAGAALLSVVGHGTPVGDLAGGAGLPLTESLAGIVLAQTFVASPFVVVTARAAFLGVDDRLTQAARTLGRGRWATARRVVLPLAARGILAGVTLAFARAMGEFGATVMLAYHPRTMPVEIWASFVGVGLEAAYPVAVLLGAVALLALGLLRLVGGDPWR
ncbi:MAG: molybdate ABC transporter permease subunit [Halobacteriales archaeon]